MKIKLIGVLISIMLITTLIVVAQPSKIITKETSANPPVSTAYSVDVPVWDIGDQWAYRIDNITLTTNQTGNEFYLYLEIADLTLTVTDINDTSYILDFKTSVKGNSIINTNFGDGPINMTINLPALKISGKVTIEKSTLGIKALSANLSGRFWIDIIHQPYIDFSIPVIPVYVRANLISDFSLPFSMLSFPLNTNMSWNSTETNITINGEIRSPWFYLFHFVNSIYPFLPPEIEPLLPIVNIKDAFTQVGTGNVFGVPMIPNAFYCLNTEMINVPGGDYEAYNITIMGGAASCFYAPSAGSVVKITGNIQQIIPYVKNINMELLSTTYS